DDGIGVFDYPTRTQYYSYYFKYKPNVSRLRFYCDFSYHPEHNVFPPTCYEIVNVTTNSSDWEIWRVLMVAPLTFPRIEIKSPQAKIYAPSDPEAENLTFNFTIYDFPYHADYGTYCRLEWETPTLPSLYDWIWIPPENKTYVYEYPMNLTAHGYGEYYFQVSCCYDATSLEECGEVWENRSVMESVRFYYQPVSNCTTDEDCGAYCVPLYGHDISRVGHCWGGRCQYESIPCESGVCNPETGYCVGTIEDCKALAEIDPLKAGICLSNLRKIDILGVKLSEWELMWMFLILLFAVGGGIWYLRR
ncbi:hypothetical protein DRH14_04090, partial [Candidatus Shapirobacteria bacterium]